jgi:hypothetical protein
VIISNFKFEISEASGGAEGRRDEASQYRERALVGPENFKFEIGDWRGGAEGRRDGASQDGERALASA